MWGKKLAFVYKMQLQSKLPPLPSPATQYQILLRSQPHLHGQETGRQNLNSRSVKDDPERDPGSC